MAETQPRKETTPNREIWVGEDFSSAEDYVLQPGGNEILITYPEESLPPAQSGISHLQAALRSLHAQSGFFDLIFTTPWNKLEQSSITGEKSGSAIAVVAGGRPVTLPKEMGLGGLFSTEGAQMLHGPELAYYVNSQEALTLDGKRGEDYRLSYDGIQLRLTPNRYTILEGKEPINIFGAEDYRHYLDEHVLRPVSPEEAVSFWVGETVSRINFLPGYYGLLHSTVIIDQKPSAKQARSRLLKPESPEWRIRIEATGREYVEVAHFEHTWVKMRVLRDLSLVLSS